MARFGFSCGGRSGIPPRARRLRRGLLRDVRGAGMVEYIIVVGVIALVSIAAFRFFGQSVMGKAQQQAGTVENEIPGGSDCIGVVCTR